MKFVLSELAAACGGRILHPASVEAGQAVPTMTVCGLSIDSRSVERGQLFVPIVAERDGHRFIAAAVEAGASAYLTAGPTVEGAAAAVEVADTMAALTAIGRHARNRLDGPIIGITGSVGKTSAKDLTLAACDTAGTAWASAASFNNELGVPLTLGNAPDGTTITIVEMGARGVGHIAELAEVARPTIGVVTAVALAHSELFGSLEGVAEAKGELVEALDRDGTAVLNADDPLVAAMASRTSAAVVTYGLQEPAAVRGKVVAVDRLVRPTIEIESEWGAGELFLPVSGTHMASNALAALAAALAAGVAFDDAVVGLGRATLSSWRMDVVESASGALVVNDAYNANPTSVRAALETLAALPADRRVAVLGIMAELGDEGPAEHAAVAAEAVAADVRVIAVDSPAYGDDVEHVADAEQAARLLGELGPGDAVLVKGSRIAELERLAERLTAEA